LPTGKIYALSVASNTSTSYNVIHISACLFRFWTRTRDNYACAIQPQTLLVNNSILGALLKWVVREEEEEEEGGNQFCLAGVL